MMSSNNNNNNGRPFNTNNNNNNNNNSNVNGSNNLPVYPFHEIRNSVPLPLSNNNNNLQRINATSNSNNRGSGNEILNSVRKVYLSSLSLANSNPLAGNPPFNMNAQVPPPPQLYQSSGSSSSSSSMKQPNMNMNIHGSSSYFESTPLQPAKSNKRLKTMTTTHTIQRQAAQTPTIQQAMQPVQPMQTMQPVQTIQTQQVQSMAFPLSSNFIPKSGPNKNVPQNFKLELGTRGGQTSTVSTGVSTGLSTSTAASSAVAAGKKRSSSTTNCPNNTPSDFSHNYGQVINNSTVDYFNMFSPSTSNTNSNNATSNSNATNNTAATSATTQKVTTPGGSSSNAHKLTSPPLSPGDGSNFSLSVLMARRNSSALQAKAHITNTKMVIEELQKIEKEKQQGSVKNVESSSRSNVNKSSTRSINTTNTVNNASANNISGGYAAINIKNNKNTSSGVNNSLKTGSSSIVSGGSIVISNFNNPLNNPLNINTASTNKSALVPKGNVNVNVNVNVNGAYPLNTSNLSFKSNQPVNIRAEKSASASMNNNNNNNRVDDEEDDDNLFCVIEKLKNNSNNSSGAAPTISNSKKSNNSIMSFISNTNNNKLETSDTNNGITGNQKSASNLSSLRNSPKQFNHIVINTSTSTIPSPSPALSPISACSSSSGSVPFVQKTTTNSTITTALEYPKTKRTLIEFLSNVPLPSNSVDESAFYASLSKFCHFWGDGLKIPKPIIVVGNVDSEGRRHAIRLHSLFRLVVRFGGFQVVTEKNLWANGAAGSDGNNGLLAILGIPTESIDPRIYSALQTHYAKYLYPYEQVMYFKKDPLSVKYPLNNDDDVAAKKSSIIPSNNNSVNDSVNANVNVNENINNDNMNISSSNHSNASISSTDNVIPVEEEREARKSTDHPHVSPFKRMIDTFGGIDLAKVLPLIPPPPIAERPVVSLKHICKSLESKLEMEVSWAINSLLSMSSSGNATPFQNYPIKLISLLIEFFESSKTIVSRKYVKNETRVPAFFLERLYELESERLELFDLDQVTEEQGFGLLNPLPKPNSTSSASISSNCVTFHRKRMLAISIVLGNLSCLPTNITKVNLLDCDEFLRWILNCLSYQYESDQFTFSTSVIFLDIFKNLLLICNNLLGFPCSKHKHKFKQQQQTFVITVFNLLGNHLLKGTAAKYCSSLYYQCQVAPSSGSICDSLPGIVFVACEGLAKLFLYGENVRMLTRKRSSSSSSSSTSSSKPTFSNSVHGLLDELNNYHCLFASLSQRYIAPSRREKPENWTYLVAKDRIYWELVLDLLLGIFQSCPAEITLSWERCGSFVKSILQTLEWMVHYMYPNNNSNNNNNASGKKSSRDNNRLVPPIYPHFVKLFRIFKCILENTLSTCISNPPPSTTSPTSLTTSPSTSLTTTDDKKRTSSGTLFPISNSQIIPWLGGDGRGSLEFWLNMKADLVPEWDAVTVNCIESIISYLSQIVIDTCC